MPVSLQEIHSGKEVVGYQVVDPGGKVHGMFVAGKRVAGKLVTSLADAKERAIALLQAININVRRAEGKSAPPAPGHG